MANSAVSTLPRDTLRTNASSSPGSSVVASCGRSASSGLSTTAVLRRGSSSARPQVSKTPAGRKGVGRISTYPDSASDLPIGAAAFLNVGQPTAGRGGRQHRRDHVETLQAQHLLDEVGRLDQVGTPTRRGDVQHRRIVRVRLHPSADLGQSADGHTVAVGHAGGAVGQVDGHLHRRAATSRHEAGRRASRSGWARRHHRRFRPAARAHRSRAATEIAGSTPRS